ncbi:UdgX family uracil-DNA binding protein [Streptomyces scabiei]|uniref:UdgX family uracil-DNA binding protein n=4 Tax=Streptomyces scabiei TaxID=1930 RepID=UPI0004E7BF89|nr:UdgX family uracil-DNA binding protein [Streptomyces scabiei]MBP5909908.1 UdgX family uracil-DNA binding protein [Streptomyces sp. LBUM 1478]MBP5927121.1 UdgX family uracil-DNA binding protein [Streptomyces sp. LBUM 1479]KFG06421.1 uracil-DNA glycosylase [Streptomyces scabiei]MDX2539198.1 UdgX family uracil-DNA binding protein [Streptomyces scabiei]MDX2800793.1 UdgX family uracil-DNA binding protein [Streptomyces scabiei]
MSTRARHERTAGPAHDAGPYLPGRGGLPAHRRAAADCRGCPLWEHATQTVFGKGDAAAWLLLVGEQPGDREDRQGEPFVGPAGRLLRRALEEAGIDMDTAYVTNAVKHFKFTRPPGGGRRRIHQAPDLREVAACRPWLLAELRLVRPEVVVVLGATAGRALLGPSFRVTRDRGALLSLPSEGTEAGPRVVATLHPSAVLRADDREGAYAGLVADLEVAAGVLAGSGP